MNALKLTVVASAVAVFAGCQCPRTAREKLLEREEVKPTALSIFAEDVERPAPVETPVETVTPVDPGVATQYDIDAAVKDEPIPPQPIPVDKVFVSPGEISAELAAIFRNIHFAFDRYDIRTEDAEILSRIGAYLLENPEMEVLIEGHCDERGTREYNLVLGEQRSLSTRRFLISLGVSPRRLYTVSYGKDMPADPRSNEEAWARNRRAEFKIAK